jgi:hypothetical protein
MTSLRPLTQDPHPAGATPPGTTSRRSIPLLLVRDAGGHECLRLGPPVVVLSRGDVVAAPRTLDPAEFQLVAAQAEPPAREPVAGEQDLLPPWVGTARAGEDGRKGETP